MLSASTDAQLADEERRTVEIYESSIHATLRPEDEGKYVAIAVDSGEFEIDADDHAVTGRLIARVPKARIWLMRTGPTAAYRF